MSFINTWAYINKTYNTNNRGAHIKKYYALNIKSLKDNYQCWLYLILHISVGAAANYHGGKHFLSGIVAISLVTILIYYLFDKKLSKDLCEIYSKYNIEDYPLFSRSRPLSYALFKEKLDKERKIKPEKIKLIIEWSDINNNKVDRTIFFKSQYFIIVITAILTIVTQHFIGLKPSGTDIILTLYFSFILMVFFWFVFDLSLWQKDKTLNIIRFLKWYEIDNKL